MEKRKETAGQDKETILIVDDMEINRAVLCETFKDDMRILEAENISAPWISLRNPLCRIL